MTAGPAARRSRDEWIDTLARLIRDLHQATLLNAGSPESLHDEHYYVALVGGANELCTRLVGTRSEARLAELQEPIVDFFVKGLA